MHRTPFQPRFFLIAAQILSKKTLFFILLGFVLSFSLGGIEFLMSYFLQLLLKILNISTINVKMMFNLESLNFSQVILGLVVISGVKLLIQIISSQSFGYAAEIVNCRLKTLMLYDMLYNVTLSKSGLSDVIYRFGEIIPKMIGLLTAFMQIIAYILQLIPITYVMYEALFKESAAGFLGIIVIAIILLPIGKAVKAVATVISEESRILSIRIQRAARNLVFFEVMRIRPIEFSFLSKTLFSLSQSVMRITFLNSFVTNVTPFFGTVLVAFILYLGKNLWNSNSLVLVSFLYLFMRFVQIMASLYGYLAQIQSNYPQFLIGCRYFSRFPIETIKSCLMESGTLSLLGKNQYLNIGDDRAKKIRVSADYIIDSKGIPPKIEISDICFKYNDTTDYTLKNISFSVNPGEKIGIRGKSGSGKTTFLQIVMGTKQPTAGKVRFDGLSPEGYFAKVENRIGYVGAEPYLIKGTIKENLLYGINIKVTEDDIWKALELANLKDFVLKCGLDYFIEEDQSGVSAGQKQRLCIARAILNKPVFMVFDEATANLDDETESIIYDSLQKIRSKCTIFVVSHRMGLINGSDKIVEF